MLLSSSINGVVYTPYPTAAFDIEACGRSP